MSPEATRQVRYVAEDLDRALEAAEHAASRLGESTLLAERARNPEAQEFYGNVQTAIDALRRARGLGEALSR